MDTPISCQANLRDERIDVLPDLLGAAADDVLRPVAALSGAEIVSARPAQVTWQVGRSLTVQYAVELRRAAAGEQERVTFVASTGGELPGGAVHLEREGSRVAVWQLPADPHLPGLAVAMDSRRARGLLDQIEAPAGDVTPRLRAYRPGRRAVVELQGRDFRVFAKAVRPGRVGALQERHRLIAAKLPVPRTHGWSERLGLVVLEARPGATLRDALGDRQSELPPAAQIEALLDLIPDPGDRYVAPDPRSAAIGHAELLKRLAPTASAEIDAIVDACGREEDSGPLIPVHGDLYEAQLLTQGGRVSGLLDIDTVGLGQRLDDLCNLLGHLVVWEPLSPDPRRVRAYAREVLTLADRRAAPSQVRLRVAAVVLALATGPFRVQSPAWPAETVQRIALATEWFGSSRKLTTRARRRVLATGS